VEIHIYKILSSAVVIDEFDAFQISIFIFIPAKKREMLKRILDSKCKFNSIPNGIDESTVSSDYMKQVYSRCENPKEIIANSLYFSAEYKASLNLHTFLPLESLEDLWLTDQTSSFLYGLFCSIPESFISNPSHHAFLSEKIRLFIDNHYSAFFDLIGNLHFWDESAIRNILKIEPFHSFLFHFFDPVQVQQDQRKDFNDLLLEGYPLKLWEYVGEYLLNNFSDELIFPTSVLCAQSDEWVEKSVGDSISPNLIEDFKLYSRIAVGSNSTQKILLENWLKNLKNFQLDEVNQKIFQYWLGEKVYHSKKFSPEESSKLASILDSVKVTHYHLPSVILIAGLDRKYFLKYLTTKREYEFKYEELINIGRCTLLLECFNNWKISPFKFLPKFPPYEQRFILNLYALSGILPSGQPRYPHHCWHLIPKELIKVILLEVYGTREEFLLYKRNLPRKVLYQMSQTWGISTQNYHYLLIHNVTKTEWEEFSGKISIPH
jgi:hypothetical protein